MGIVLALISALIFAFSYTSLKKSYKNLAPSVSFSIDVLFGLLIWIPVTLLIGIDFSKLGTVFVYALLSAILAEAFYFYVLSKGELSITGTILATYPLYTILFSFFINKEHLLPIYWLFIGAVLVGLILVSLPKKFHLADLHKKSFILWALFGAFAVGLSDALSKYGINHASASTFIFVLALIQIPVAILYLILEKQSLNQFTPIIHKFKYYKFSLLGGFLNITGVLFLLFSFQFTFASIAAPISASYPVIMVILAAFFLKERIRKRDYVGILLMTVGIVGISYFFR